jgi:hypothetical protein
MQGHADRNASLVIGQRLITRSQTPFKEKPHALAQRAKGEPEGSGVVLSQDAKRERRPSTDLGMRHGERNGHGTAQEGTLRMDERPSDIPTQLRLFNE